MEISVEKLFKERGKELGLKLISGERGLARRITVAEVNRLGLQLTGYLDYFPMERVQIVGLGEISYLQGRPISSGLTRNLERIFESPIPCVMVSRNLEIPKSFLSLSEKHGVSLFLSSLETGRLMTEVALSLEEMLAPSVTLHGVLVDVQNLGVLILGESGIGKSECALDLLRRGNLLVADDLVEIKKKAGSMLIGASSKEFPHHMELRGIGIIDVKSLLGLGSVLDSARVELVVRLEEWDEKRAYDRLGLDTRYTEILDVKIPEIIVPVRPGRSLAILIEVAALNQRLKNRGTHTAQAFDAELKNILKAKAK